MLLVLRGKIKTSCNQLLSILLIMNMFMLSLLQDKEAKVRVPNQRSGTSKAGGWTMSSKGKEVSHTHHNISRYRSGSSNLPDNNVGEGSSGGKSAGKTGSIITSSNRFEKLDPDIDCEASGMGMNISSSTTEDGSPPSVLAPGHSMPFSGSAASLIDAEEKSGGEGAGAGKERSERGRRSNNRKGVSSRLQQVHGYGGTAVGVSSRTTNAPHGNEELGSKEGLQGDVHKKKSSRHIKFDIPTGADSSPQPRDSFSTTSFSSSTLSSSKEDLSVDPCSVDGSCKVFNVELSSKTTPSVDSCEPQTDQPKRIVYERVSGML